MTLESISYDELFPDYTKELLISFRELYEFDLNRGTILDFEIIERENKNKMNPFIRYANIGDIDDIITIYKSIYGETYPYKEMEDHDEILKKIKSPKVEWIVFENYSREVVGCVTFELDFEDKKGYLRGFNFRKEFFGKVDVIKAAIGSFLGMYSKYKGRIYRWYAESRTAHAKSQYALGAGGLKPVAFFPCKDIFHNKIESDILLVCYDEETLKKYRSKKIPIIIPEVQDCFEYSDMKYGLGDKAIVNPKINLDLEKVKKIQEYLEKTTKKDKFGYIEIIYSIKSSDSYFKFLYTPQVQNFEKTEYKVSNLEELYVFSNEFKQCARKNEVRYLEVFVPGYDANHQKIFSDLGFNPGGYVPSWKFNKKTQSFEDSVVFNSYEGMIDENIQLIGESKNLLCQLGYKI